MLPMSIRGAPIKTAAAPLTVQQGRPRRVTSENVMLLSKLSRLFQNARRPSSEFWRGSCPRCPPLPPPLFIAWQDYIRQDRQHLPLFQIRMPSTLQHIKSYFSHVVATLFVSQVPLSVAVSHCSALWLPHLLTSCLLYRFSRRPFP